MGTTTSPTTTSESVVVPPVTESQPSRDQSVVLHGLTWQQYSGILQALGDHRMRHSYSNGTLEIMSSLQKHEWDNRFIERLVERLAEELGIETMSLGSWTLNRAELDKGLEPDSCFYVANEALVRSNEAIDLDKDPPPDLAVEIDLTSSSVPRQSIYEALRVPELWRYAKGQMRFLQLRDGNYVEISHSIAFPILSSDKLVEMITSRKEKSELQVVKDLVAWVREQQG